MRKGLLLDGETFSLLPVIPLAKVSILNCSLHGEIPNLLGRYSSIIMVMIMICLYAAVACCEFPPSSLDMKGQSFVHLKMAVADFPFINMKIAIFAAYSSKTFM